MNSLHIKKGDVVRVIAGNLKGSEAKVVRSSFDDGLVFLENINIVKRRVKPSQLNPRGLVREVHKGVHVSNVKKMNNKEEK
jgi:large subunit ribosomal protein L24